jgi:hypothetical protein
MSACAQPSQTHCAVSDNESDDAYSNSSYPLHQRDMHQLLRADVHRCSSLVCIACALHRDETTFLPVQRIDPRSIRRLPSKWWDTNTVASEDGYYNVTIPCAETADEICRFHDHSTGNSNDASWMIIRFNKRLWRKRSRAASEESRSMDDTDASGGMMLCLCKICVSSLDEEESTANGAAGM